MTFVWPPTSGSPTGPAGGDLSGTYPNPTVALVGGATAAAVATAATAVASGLQGVYSAGPSGLVIVDAVRGAEIVRDNAVPLGTDLFRVEDNASFGVLAVALSDTNLGRHSAIVSTGSASILTLQDASNSILLWPGGRTFTSSQGAVMFLTGTYVLDYASVAFAGLSLTATIEHAQAGFVFNHALLFNHGNTYRNTLNVNLAYGPIQGFIDQPVIQVNRTTPGVVTLGQLRSFLSQPSFGRTAAGGTLTVTLVGQVQCFGAVTTGATVTTWNRLQLGPFSALTGAITTYRAVLIADETGPGTITGIRCELTGVAKTFIDHVGTAVSNFAGEVFMNNAVPLTLGTSGGSRINLLRSSAGVMRMIGVGGANNEGLDWNFQSAPNVVLVTSSTGAELRVEAGITSLAELQVRPVVGVPANDRYVQFSDGTNTYEQHSGTVAPSAGAGVAAPVGSTFQRNNGGVGEFWVKTGAAATAWTQVV